MTQARLFELMLNKVRTTRRAALGGHENAQALENALVAWVCACLWGERASDAAPGDAPFSDYGALTMSRIHPARRAP
ncbi:MAG TPA: hypothetical protein VFG44_08240, partial [Burkholderiales bacterium]|nr:hypothetical protein [Burkholderiales bacterium]